MKIYNLIAKNKRKPQNNVSSFYSSSSHAIALGKRMAESDCWDTILIEEQEDRMPCTSFVPTCVVWKYSKP